MAGEGSGLRLDAERLYVEEDASIKEIADLLGVPAKSIGNWRTRHGWVKKRQARKERLHAIGASLRKLRDSMLDHALETLSPQNVYAVLSLDKAVREREVKEKPEPTLFLAFLKTLTEILKERAPAAVAAIHDNYDGIIQGFKERGRTDG